MKSVVNHADLGEIVYEESFWSGRKSLSVNGVALKAEQKNVFLTEENEKVQITGGYLRGAKMSYKGETVALSSPVKWYEIVLSVLPFVLILVWGNSAALCKIVPVIGGAIGGAVSAVFSFANLLVIKTCRKLWLKILISVGVLALTFLICSLLGLAAISILS